jgi:UDP-4-amino-4,6-dideoxy-N-acetyl-beta-L-altrosamine N-acetyltransferase
MISHGKYELSRRFDEEIADKMLIWRNNDSVRKYCRQLDFITPADHCHYMNRMELDSSQRMYVLHYNGTAIGICGFTSIDTTARRAEFSFYIAPEFQRRGHSVPGLTLLFDHGFDVLNLNRIWGEVFSFNHAANIFEKIGMEKEGVRKEFYFKSGRYVDATLYSIGADKWRSLR